MEDHIVLFLQHYSEVTTDFQAQSRKIVKQDNTVIVADLGNPQARPSFQNRAGMHYFTAMSLEQPGLSWLRRWPRVMTLINAVLLLWFCILHVPGFWSKKKVLWLTDQESDTFFHYLIVFLMSLYMTWWTT
jgi:hypothetical protein